MRWFERMMYGRHGVDELSVFIIVLAFILGIIAPFTPHICYVIISVITFILLAIYLFRILSKNHSRRYAENIKFLKLWNPVKSWFKFQYKKIKEHKTHRYYKCPNCKKVLRVPRGIGKVNITCPSCKTKFIKKA